MLFLAVGSTMAQFVGEVALLSLAAILVGFVLSKVVPASWNPTVFAVLVPLLGLATWAYVGSTAAAFALIGFVVLAVSAGFAGIV
jgi:hypothetical protein